MNIFNFHQREFTLQIYILQVFTFVKKPKQVGLVETDIVLQNIYDSSKISETNQKNNGMEVKNETDGERIENMEEEQKDILQQGYRDTAY